MALSASVEKYSKWTNLMQLVFGLMSIAIYISITVIQSRFFPIKVRNFSFEWAQALQR